MRCAVASRIFLLALAGVLVTVLVLVYVSRDGGEEPKVERVLAPIDALEIRVLDSLPPQYVLDVTAGLPNGCARADGYDVDRLGDTVRVRVYNTMPTGNVACTLIYGTYQLSIPLGSDFQSRREYTVDVNGQLTTLHAQ